LNVASFFTSEWTYTTPVNQAAGPRSPFGKGPLNGPVAGVMEVIWAKLVRLMPKARAVVRAIWFIAMG
jgi:hypothetical protein